MDKRVAIVAGDQIFDALVAPGSTASDVLAQAGLQGYFLSKREGLPFGDTEVIYSQIRDGEKLHSSAQATVGE